MILLDAIYINQSGGKVLLEYFINHILDGGQLSDFFFLLDSRLDSPCLSIIPLDKQLRVSSSEGTRRDFYKKLSPDIVSIFCFANVPPPIKIRDRKVCILFHNTLILSNKDTHYSLRNRFSFFLKRLYIRNKTINTYKWIVQTKVMSDLLLRKLKIDQNSIEILPFYQEKRFSNLNSGSSRNRGEFLYVADGVKQKNHQALLKAWELIFDTSSLPITLHLTVPRSFDVLMNEITRLQKRGARIINHGHSSFEELKQLYGKCYFFVNASLTESFGLPLIEAAEAGCEIISADLEYVYEIVKPLAIFDPHDAQNMAETIISAYQGSYNNNTEIVVKNKIGYLTNLICNNV